MQVNTFSLAEMPLLRAQDINVRLDAIDELRGMPDFVDEIRDNLKRLPDLERSTGEWKLCFDGVVGQFQKNRHDTRIQRKAGILASYSCT